MDQNSSAITPQPSKTDSISLILTACIISILLIYLVYTRNFVFGSALGNWVYPYLTSIPIFPLWIPLIVLLLLGLSVFIGSKLIQSYERITLFLLFLNAVFIQSLIRMVYPFSLGSVVQSDSANSFYTPAMSFSAVEILSKFIALAPSFPLHARSNMPGKILLFELFKLFTSSPEVMGYLIIIISSLGALLLYGICKRLFHNNQAAFYALTLYVLIPCKLFHFPLLNTVTPVLMLVCFYLFVIYLEKKNILIAWLLGAFFYLLILFEPSPLITGFVFLGILICAIREKRFSIKDFYRLFINAFLAFLVMHIIFYLGFSFNIFSSFLYILKDATNFNIIYERGYLIWLMENSREFFFGVGIPVMIIFIYMTTSILVQTKTLASLSHWSLENVFVISLLVTFLVLLFSGINRGEVIRLWIYLAVLFQVPASIFIAKIEKGTFIFFLVASLIAVQTMVALHRVGFNFP
jgi:hypothetical protein